MFAMAPSRTRMAKVFSTALGSCTMIWSNRRVADRRAAPDARRPPAGGAGDAKGNGAAQTSSTLDAKQIAERLIMKFDEEPDVKARERSGT